MPLINNWQGREIRTGAEAREGLYQQVPNPVRWTESIQRLIAMGFTEFVECGPGGVIAGLLKRIDPNVTCLSLETHADIVKHADALI